MSPTDMWDALHALRVQHWTSTAPLKERRRHPDSFPRFGLVRVQWSGPWCKPGVPIKARYCYTHWVASVLTSCLNIFDINATCVGWLSFWEWSTQLVPWLLRDKRRHDGTWWITHSAEVLL